MKEFSRNKQLVINMSASFIAYGVSLFISFFLSPYIVRTIGVEANGFVSLANNFVNYASLITLALNSLAGRFITICIVKGDTKGANKYFSSVFYANLIIAFFLGIVGLLIIVFLEKLINIPGNLVSDVRLLFICLFLNCLVSVIGSVFSVATFARNKLYLESLRNIESNLARALIIVGLFAFSNPKVCYVGLGSLVSGIYVLICNLYYTKKLLPEIRIEKTSFDFKAVLELTAAGIWNTINRLGTILLDGLDLLISNLFISTTAMGVLSLSKTVPSLITSLLNSVVGVFSPDFTILYAEGKKAELIKSIRQSMKIMGIIINTPIVVLIVCGKEFFELWQPTQDADLLQKLFLLTIGCLIFSGGINCLYGVFTVLNKIKANSLAVLIGGAVSVSITFILVKNTDLGIFAVAGVSTIVSIIRNLIFTAPYGACCLGMKWYSFYPDIFKPVLFTIVGSVLGMAVGSRIYADNWLIWFVKAALIGIVVLLIGIFIMLNNEERQIVKSKTVDKVRKK